MGFGARVRQTGRPAAHIRIPVIPDACVQHRDAQTDTGEWTEHQTVSVFTDRRAFPTSTSHSHKVSFLRENVDFAQCESHLPAQGAAVQTRSGSLPGGQEPCERRGRVRYIPASSPSSHRPGASPLETGKPFRILVISPNVPRRADEPRRSRSVPASAQTKKSRSQMSHLVPQRRGDVRNGMRHFDSRKKKSSAA